ncbi:MAG TPA: 50S ribosomal protein L30e [Candidatus Poseidoniia archaeon]|jgi:large subunit ribosomal protein L30e|nr:50S ribosomal protein L30e [Candidatus Poseidoniia archaeon]|tara:strand:+ start:8750 stop:9037 length:288 start_codon:yes stop_codon:yes gene_type:complete
MDINKALRSAIETGTVHVGARESCKAANAGTAKLIIISSNCPEEAASQVKESESPVHSFSGNNAVLGAACGKPFPVSVVAILDSGKSDVLSLKAD